MKTTGATTSVTRTVDLIKAWMAHHNNALNATIVHFQGHKLSSFISLLVIGIVIALPSLLYVTLTNISALSGDWGGKPRISLYLEREVTQSVGRNIADEISADAKIESVRFISSEAALKDFQQLSGLSDVMNSLERNPLPHVIEVVLKTMDPIASKELAAAWRNSDSIAKVSFDLAWLERLTALLGFGKRLVGALSLILGFGVILIMANTIRLTIENRRQEIEVIKLVGGSDSFVRRPFLYLGLSYGLGGAFLAIAILQFVQRFLAGPVEILAQSYLDGFALEGLSLSGYLVMLTIGSVLGILAALLAVSKHLQAIEP